MKSASLNAVVAGMAKGAVLVSSIILNVDNSLTSQSDLPNCIDDRRHILKGSSIVSIRIIFIIINLIIFIISH